MTTLVIVGAGKGLGAAVARKFGAEGFDVALVARNQDRVDALAAELGAEGISARGWTANVRDPQALADVLDQIAQEQGPIEVLQYSPLPQKEFLRPVLETSARDLVGAIEFSVYGPVAAAHQVLEGMRYLEDGGSILFVNGGSGAKASGSVAGTSIAFAGLGAYGEMLHDAVKDDGVHVGQLIIPGEIDEESETSSPTVLAEKLWAMHTEKGDFRVFASPMD